MQTGFLVAGFLFLINPSIMTFDILPDFIGFLLISRGLFRLSFLEEHMEVSRKISHYLVLLSVLKFFFSFSAISTPIESNRLLISFVFFVGEVILFYLFISHFFKGLNALAVRLDSERVFHGFEVARILTLAFFGVRCFLDLLPQLIVLFYSEVDADPSQVVNYAAIRSDYLYLRNLTLIFAAVVILAFGIYCARILFAYRKSCMRDVAFCERLADLYRCRVTDNENALLRIHVRRALVYFTAASFFLVPLYLDDFNFLPRPLFFVLLFLGMHSLQAQVPFSKGRKALLAAGFAVSLLSYGYRIFCMIAYLDFYGVYRHSLIGLLLAATELVFTVTAAFFLFQTLSCLVREKFTFSYRCYRIFLFLAAVLLIAVSFYCEHFSYRIDLVMAAEWAVFFLFFYFYKKGFDSIRSEMEWKYL